MPHWLQATVAVAGALASWRWIVRPLRRIFREVLDLLRQIRDASGGVQVLGRELHALAGSFVLYAMDNHRHIEQLRVQQAELADKARDLTELYVDVQADIARLRRGA